MKKQTLVLVVALGVGGTVLYLMVRNMSAANASTIGGGAVAPGTSPSAQTPVPGLPAWAQNPNPLGSFLQSLWPF